MGELVRAAFEASVKLLEAIARNGPDVRKTLAEAGRLAQEVAKAAERRGR